LDFFEGQAEEKARDDLDGSSIDDGGQVIINAVTAATAERSLEANVHRWDAVVFVGDRDVVAKVVFGTPLQYHVQLKKGRKRHCLD